MERSDSPNLLLMLDHVQDPQNLGALLRSAECAGVDGVLIPKDRAAAVTSTVVRASAGASEHLRVVKVTNLVRTMKSLRDHGIWWAGLEGSPEAVLYSEADLAGSVGLVVGSEGRGLSRLVRETCDYLIRLPLRGRIHSLNAAVAGGLALYECLRQRDLADS
jgi:23S rRNA (guanosine2251-2'-O)-methyltransferase